MGLDGKVALVTGSSRGIGRAIALALAEAGADVVVNYPTERDLVDAEEVGRGVTSLGRRTMTVMADVTQREAVVGMVERVEGKMGPIDILVNNAAIFQRHVPFWELDEDEWDGLFAVNVKGPLHASQAVTPSMRSRRSGAILNISSLGAVATLPGYAAYVSSKGALEALTRALAVELAPWNITVNAVSPGHIDTPPNVEEIMADPARGERYLKRIALGRLGKMEEVGKTVAFLVSEDAGYITGQVLQVEGGISMWQGPIR